MKMMNRDLEGVIEVGRGEKFRSEGECRIANFLENNSIRYHYEPGVLVNSPYDKPRIWYPDFYLPEFGVYIEYYGLVGKQNYDEGIKRKEVAYAKMGLDVVPVYPWTFADDWQGYLMKELEHVTRQRYGNLMAKPYWLKRRRYSQNLNASTMKNSYGPGFRKQY